MLKVKISGKKERYIRLGIYLLNFRIYYTNNNWESFDF